MKYIFTCLTLLSSLGLYAQNVQMPFNPDYDGDNVVATTDFLAVLPLFGSTMVDTSLTCDYAGTDLEEFMGGVFGQSIVIDSVYVEYLIIDTALTFVPGCPDPVEIETVLERSYMIKNFYSNFFASEPFITGVTQYLQFQRQFELVFNPVYGWYRLMVSDFEVGGLTSFDQYAFWGNGDQTNVSLPFPESWTLDEDGIQVDWYPGSWVESCEHFRLIPYWHQAE